MGDIQGEMQTASGYNTFFFLQMQKCPTRYDVNDGVTVYNAFLMAWTMWRRVDGLTSG